jgi:hypothetical protein
VHAVALASPAERGQRAHVERIQVELLGPVLERRRERPAPGRRRLARQAVHEIDVERRGTGVADRAQRAVDVVGALRSVDGAALLVDEALHADADAVGAAVLDGDGEPVRQGGLGRRLDGHRDPARRSDGAQQIDRALELPGVE